MYDMLHYYLRHYQIPVCYDFPVGHHSGLNLPMVEGCPVRLSVDAEHTVVEFLQMDSSNGAENMKNNIEPTCRR